MVGFQIPTVSSSQNVVCCCKLNNTRVCDEHYSDKLAHIQVVINCRYSISQMCTREDMLAQYLGAPHLDDVMSHNELTTNVHVLYNKEAPSHSLVLSTLINFQTTYKMVSQLSVLAERLEGKPQLYTTFV